MAASVPDYSIRLMREEEIPAVLDLWRETGLSEGTHSVRTWYRYDPQGFYVAAATENDEILGVCAGILQHEDLAFVGMYAVKQAFQRRGIGTRIWQAVMDRIGDRNAGVNPVPNQLANYRDRAGFPVQTTWRSVVCVAPQIRLDGIVREIPGYKVCRLLPEDPMVQEVGDYDTHINGFKRESMVELLTVERDSITMFGVNQNYQVCGYGNIKKSIKGNALVGPLYADDAQIAELILWQLIREFPLARKCGLTLMIIDSNQEAAHIAEKLGLKKQSGIARLYRKDEVETNISKIFGQHNLNFSVF